MLKIPLTDYEVLQLQLEGAHSQCRLEDRRRRAENHAISMFSFPPLGRWFDQERKRMNTISTVEQK